MGFALLFIILYAYFHHVVLFYHSPPLVSVVRFCDSSGVWIFGMQNVCQAKNVASFCGVLTHATSVYVCMYIYM